MKFRGLHHFKRLVPCKEIVNVFPAPQQIPAPPRILETLVIFIVPINKYPRVKAVHQLVTSTMDINGITDIFEGMDDDDQVVGARQGVHPQVPLDKLNQLNRLCSRRRARLEGHRRDVRGQQGFTAWGAAFP